MKKQLTFGQKILRAIAKQFEKKDEECTILEKEVSEIINGALTHPDSITESDTENRKYVIKNNSLHLTITINQDSAMIRITNSIHNTAEKYRVAFVDNMVEVIRKETSMRIEKIFSDVDDTMLRLIKSTNRNVKIANGDITPKISKEMKAITKEIFEEAQNALIDGDTLAINHARSTRT